jgi:hypothetical protein
MIVNAIVVEFVIFLNQRDVLTFHKGSMVGGALQTSHYCIDSHFALDLEYTHS